MRCNRAGRIGVRLQDNQVVDLLFEGLLRLSDTGIKSVGDHAIALSAELRYAPDWLGSLKSTLNPYVYAFIDYGRLWAIDALNAPFFTEGASTGAGPHVRLLEKLSGEVEIAKIIAGRTSATSVPHPWRFSFRVGSAF